MFLSLPIVMEEQDRALCMDMFVSLTSSSACIYHLLCSPPLPSAGAGPELIMIN